MTYGSIRSVLFVLIFAPSMGWAGTNSGDQGSVLDPLVKPILTESFLALEPIFKVQQFHLRVTGPEAFIWERTFDGNDVPVIELYEVQPVDGLYRFELVGMPILSEEAYAWMTNARDRGESIGLDALRDAGYLGDVDMVFSGVFRIEGGLFFVPEPGVEAPYASKDGLDDADEPGRDFLIGNDLIVHNSACVGFDCVDNEVWGADTIRLKENNLRIHFEDTSTVGSFPTCDWRIIANSNASGGACYLAFQDSDAGTMPFRVDSNAGNNALRVTSQGNVGIGTGTPAVELHVASGDSPAMRLEQNTSSGFAPQSWDVAGNETSFFIRDATNGSTLPFRIQPGAESNSIFIANTSNVGFGTTNPSAGNGADRFIEVKSDTSSAVIVDSGTGASDYAEFSFEEGNSAVWSTGFAGNSNRYYIYNYGRSEYDLNVNDGNGYIGIGDERNPSHPIEHSNGAHLTSGGVWTNASSRAYKENIAEITGLDALQTVMGLAPVRYTYIAEPDEEYMGFIAEDVPEMVATKDRQSLSPMDVTAVLTKVVQEQQSLIERQQQLMESLQQRIEHLESLQ